jgi:hypothetical protein
VRAEGIAGVPEGDGEARPAEVQLGGGSRDLGCLRCGGVPLAARRDGGASGHWRPLGPDLGPFGPIWVRVGRLSRATAVLPRVKVV